MTCPLRHEQAPLFVGGELLGKDHLNFERHLAECEDCRAFVADIQASLDWFKDDAQAPFSLKDRQQFRQGLMARVREEVSSQKCQRLMIWKTSAAWMGLAAAVLLVVMVGRNQQETTNTELPPVALNGSADVSKTDMSDESLKTGSIPPAKPLTTRHSTIQPPMKPRQAPNPVPRADAPLEMAKAAQAPACIEFQTDNPNIRIIWLARCQGVGQGAEPEPLPELEIPWPSVEEPPVPPIS